MCVIVLQVIARTVIPTDALDRSSGQATVGELVSRNAECKDLAEYLLANNAHIYSQVTTSCSIPVFPYNGSLINLDVFETRTTGSGQEAAGELVSRKMHNATAWTHCVCLSTGHITVTTRTVSPKDGHLC